MKAEEVKAYIFNEKWLKNKARALDYRQQQQQQQQN
jgi:hypothetical protein